jgi:hypothetical protein
MASFRIQVLLNNMPDTIIPFDQMANLDNPVFRAAGVSPAPSTPESAAIPFDQIESAPSQAIDASQITHIDDFHRRNADDISRDDKFDPRVYFAENPDIAKDPAQLQKLIDVYRSRRERGVTLGAVGEGIKAAPGTAAKFAKGLGTLANNVFEFSGLQPLFNKAASVVTGDAFDKQRSEALDKESENRARQAHSEFQAATELSATGLSDLGRTGARKIFGKSVKDSSDQELLAQLSEDAAFQNQLREVQSGRGESLKNAGLDADTLEKDGIHLDSNAIENLSLVDPATVIATAGLFKVVGTGGKILATAASESSAAKAATALNNLATKTAAGTLKLGGRAATGIAKAVGAVPEEVAGTVGATLGSQGGFGTAYAGARAGKLIQAGIERGGQAVGRVLTNVGEHITPVIPGTERVPLSPGIQKLQNFVGTYGRPVTGAVKGAAIGTAAAAPLALLADDDQTAGGILSGGIGLGAVAGTAHGTFGAVTEATSNRYFGAHEKLLPAVNSPSYGIEPALDAAHQAKIQAVPVRERNLVNNFREGTRNLGGEFYMVNEAEYTKGVADAYKRETGQDITPELLKKYADTHAQFSEYRPDPNGNVRKVVLLNGDAKGLLHDAGHLFDASLTPEVADSLRNAVRETFTPEQLADAQARYERRLGTKLTPERGMDEFIAEQFNALFHNVPLNEMTAPRSLIGKFIDTIAKGAEALGVDLTAGKVTPDLSNPLSVGLRELFKNAASEITEANKNANPQTPPAAPGGPAAPTLTPSPAAPAGPAAPVPTAPVTPAAPAPAAPAAPRNIRVTKAQQDAFAKRAAETGVTEAKANAAGEPETAARVKEISDSMEAGNPVLEIEHLGIADEGSPQAPTGRTVRRAKQAKGYADLEEIRADNRANAPESIVNRHQKTFAPGRWTNQGNTPTLIAFSNDKIIHNIHAIVADAAHKGVADLLPYKTEGGKLTELEWERAVKDAQAYSENQANGFRGDGRQLTRPTEDLGFSIPAENPDYVPKLLDPPEANFQNLIQGLATPETSREQKGLTPGNIKAQILAEANQRPTLTPSQIKRAHAGKQEFKSFPGRSVKEVNPLRNDLVAAGVDVRDLFEVTERIRAKDITSVKPRPDLNFKAPVTDVIRGGFLPKEGQSVADFGAEILKTSPEEWVKRTQAFPGGLTAEAFRLGHGLKNLEDVQVLRDLAKQADKQVAEARAAKDKDLDAIFAAGFKKQFFNEAIETATGSSPDKRAAIGNTLGADWQPPFPQAGGEAKFLPKVAPTPEIVQEMRNAAPEVKDKSGNPKPFFGKTRMPEDYKGRKFLRAESGEFGHGYYFTDSSRNPGGKTRPAEPGEGKVRGAQVFVNLKNPLNLSEKLSAPDVQKVIGEVQQAVKMSEGDPRQQYRLQQVLNSLDVLGEAGGSAKDLVAALLEKGTDNEVVRWLQKAGYDGLYEKGKLLTPDTLVAWDNPQIFAAVAHAEEFKSKVAEQHARIGTGNVGDFLQNIHKADVYAASLTADEITRRKEIREAPTEGDKKRAAVEAEKARKAGTEIQFLPRTKAGRDLVEKGFDFRVTGQPGTRAITVLKDGVAVGEFQSAQRTPKIAEISNVQLNKKFRGTGAAEAAYRELLTQLKDDGAKRVEGTVVAPQPLALRKKIFGGFDKLELNGEPVSIDDAIHAANEIKTSRAREILNIEAVNEITPESQFLPKKTEPQKLPEYLNSKFEKLFTQRVIRQIQTVGAPEYFWLGKDGRVIPAPDPGGHKGAAEAVLGRKFDQLDDAYGAMREAGFSRAGFERGAKTGSPIFLSGVYVSEITPSMRRTLEDIAFKSESRVKLDDRDLDIGPNQEPSADESPRFLPKKTDENKSQFPGYVTPAPQNRGLEKTVDVNGVTEQFWIHSKTGKVILAPDGHEEAAGSTVFKDNAAIRGAGDSAVYDAMYARGWIRGILEPDDTAKPAIHLNGAADGGPLGAAARRTMEDIAFKLDRPVLFNDRQLDIGPVQPNDAPDSLFLPKKQKRDDEGRPLTKDGLIDYGRLYKEKVAADKKQEREDAAKPTKSYDIPNNQTELSPKGLTGWILPDKKFVPLDTQYHEQFLAENSAKLNDQFGTDFSDVSNVDSRLAALNAGFTRLRYEANRGALHIETAAKNWASARKQILDRVLEAEGSIDNLFVSLLDAQGKVVDSISEKLFNVEGAEKLNKIEEALDSLRARGSRFLPKEQTLPGFKPETADDKTKLAESAIARAKNDFPEARLPVYARDDQGNVRLNWEGSALTVPVDYDLSNTPLAKEAAKGLKGPDREKAIAAALGDKLVTEYQSAVKNPSIEAGSKWYSTARTRLRKLLGDDAKFFAELLGATSPQTSVETNFKYSVEAYNQFKSGAYDEMLAKYREGKQAWADANLDDFLRDTKIEQPTRGQFLDWWVKKNNRIPVQSNGKRFGLHSRAVLRVLDRSWLSEVKGPKTPNFTGNLTGETFEATIDVWAARALHRLANEGNPKRWRILPGNETGVTDPDFYLGQAAYRHAAEKLNIKPDALQAVLWFAEKNYWENRNWTKAAGAKKSDFNSLLGETERSLEGKLTPKKRQLEL